MLSHCLADFGSLPKTDSKLSSIRKVHTAPEVPSVWESLKKVSCGLESEFLQDLCQCWFDFLEVEVEHEMLAGWKRDLAELRVEFAGMEVEDAGTCVCGVVAEGVFEKPCGQEAGVEAAGSWNAQGSEGESVEGQLPELAVAGLGGVFNVRMVGCEGGVRVAVKGGSGGEDAGIVLKPRLLKGLEDPGVVGAEAEEGGAEA
jgi:hypothetical protein